MYRQSTTSERRSLQHPPALHTAPPKRPPNHGRHGILATVLLLGLTLVTATWISWRDAEALADTISEGQGELYLRAFHDFSSERSFEQGFHFAIERYGQSGLLGGGYFNDGTFQVVAGTFSPPIPVASERPHGRMLVRIGNRYRIFIHLPPGGPPGRMRPGHRPPIGPPPHDKPPFPPPPDGLPPLPPGADPSQLQPMRVIAFEFEPVLATGLTQRARMTFFLATGVATLLAVAAIVLWRRAQQEDALGIRLAEAERLASLGTMSAVLAHEIKNPLASLKGNAQLLAESLSPESRARSQADRVVEAALRLQGLVQNLLDFARGGPIERTDVDPAELLFLAAEDAAPSAILELDQAPPVWSLDAIRMRQVLENLLRNALQASEGGTVKARVFVQDNHLVYVIEDNGTGFAPGSLDNLFEPFFTTKSRGVGLGLAVARRIVTMHAGSIAARNKPEGGAEVTVSIPELRGTEELEHGKNSRSG